MKYKYNNEWVDVNIKALDSMPVGTQVEYTGDTIPTGWEQVNDYSTTEIDTGKKWIDGKPIYRKVVSDTTSSSSDQTMLSTITNLDYCISIKGILVDSGYSIVIPSYVNSNNYTNCAMTDGKKPYLSVSSGYRSKAFTLIIEYTKTTD